MCMYVSIFKSSHAGHTQSTHTQHMCFAVMERDFKHPRPDLLANVENRKKGVFRFQLIVFCITRRESGEFQISVKTRVCNFLFPPSHAGYFSSYLSPQKRKYLLSPLLYS